MMLPPLLVLTDRTQARRPLPDVVRAAVDGGARVVVVREKDLPRRERARLVDTLRPLLADVGGRLLVASDPAIEADGVHLAADDPLPAPRPGILGRSCHDASGLAAATTDGLDEVTLSPVAPTPSKPGYGPTLGYEGVRRLCATTPIPVYALGGVDVTNAARWRAAGAAGVAVMGSVMRSARPDRVVAELLAAMIRCAHSASSLHPRHPAKEADACP